MGVFISILVKSMSRVIVKTQLNESLDWYASCSGVSLTSLVWCLTLFIYCFRPYCEILEFQTNSVNGHMTSHVETGGCFCTEILAIIHLSLLHSLYYQIILRCASQFPLAFLLFTCTLILETWVTFQCMPVFNSHFSEAFFDYSHGTNKCKRKGCFLPLDLFT